MSKTALFFYIFCNVFVSLLLISVDGKDIFRVQLQYCFTEQYWAWTRSCGSDRKLRHIFLFFKGCSFDLHDCGTTGIFSIAGFVYSICLEKRIDKINVIISIQPIPLIYACKNISRFFILLFIQAKIQYIKIKSTGINSSIFEQVSIDKLV